MSKYDLEVSAECRIARPIDIVRAHFLDFHHHIARDVHKGIRYTVLGTEGNKQRVRSEFKVLGMPKVDELLVYEEGGSVIQDFVKGDFAGGVLRVDFEVVEPALTALRAEIKAPLRGLNKLLAPVIRRMVVKLTDQAIAEDIHDLEVAGYEPSMLNVRPTSGAFAEARA